MVWRLRVRDFDAHRGFPGDALDQDGFRLEREAQIIGEAGDAAVFDACFRLEFVGGDDGTGIDLRDAAADVKLLALLLDGVRAFLQFIFLDFFAGAAPGEASQGREGGSSSAPLEIFGGRRVWPRLLPLFFHIAGK